MEPNFIPINMNESIEIKSTLSQNITSEWVRDHLMEAIYLNGEMSALEIPPFRQLKAKLKPFSLPEANPLAITTNNSNTVDNILSIMLSKSVLRGRKKLIKPFLQTIKDNMQVLADNEQPLNFVLPTLPFKDQSPFGTGANIYHTDLGEYCIFAQLKRILEAIKSIYAPGAHMTLLCDGYIYADIFTNGNKDGAGQYKAKCEELKNRYGLYNDVTLLDMREVFFNVPHWEHIEKTIQEKIWELYHSNEEVKQRVDFLARRFVFYTALSKLSYEEARVMYMHSPWPHWVWETLLNSAVKYASIHLTMKKTNLIANAFPYAIRCTVHPKAAAQLALHMTNAKNDLLPYNGVAVVSRQAVNEGLSLYQALRIRRLCDVLRYEDVHAVYTTTAKDPFYYEVA